MLKQWEIPLYGLTAFFCVFVDDLRILLAIVIVDAALLFIVWVRCRKLLKEFDSDRYFSTKKLLDAAETCFVMTVIFAVFSLVRMGYYMIFQPESFFAGGLWLGYLVQILPSVGLLVFFHLTGARLLQVQRQKSYIDHPPSEKLEDFYAFIHSADKEEDKPAAEMPDASDMLDELIPDEEEFNRHLRQIAAANPPQEPKQLWECPLCGSMNPADSGQCDFCGTDRENKLSDQ